MPNNQDVDPYNLYFHRLNSQSKSYLPNILSMMHSSKVVSFTSAVIRQGQSRSIPASRRDGRNGQALMRPDFNTHAVATKRQAVGTTAMNEASASINRLKTSWIAADGIQQNTFYPTVLSARTEAQTLTSFLPSALSERSAIPQRRPPSGRQAA
jgi:hypothetical protein